MVARDADTRLPSRAPRPLPRPSGRVGKGLAFAGWLTGPSGPELPVFRWMTYYGPLVSFVDLAEIQMDVHVPPPQGSGLDGAPSTGLGSFFQSLLYWCGVLDRQSRDHFPISLSARILSR